MTIAEEMAIKMLKDFCEQAKTQGICFIGCDMDEPMQRAVVKIVKQYIEEYEEEFGEGNNE